MKMKTESNNIWSYITLFLLTGIVGSLIVIPIGYVITKILKKPKTSYDDYGWRGVGLFVIFFGIFGLVLGIIAILEGNTDSVLGTIFVGIIFGVAPIYLGKKLIVDWT